MSNKRHIGRMILVGLRMGLLVLAAAGTGEAADGVGLARLEAIGETFADVTLRQE